MVRPKKFLGQRFLRDDNIARKIAGYLNPAYPLVLEVGPGTGALSRHLLSDDRFETWFMEVDREAAAYLRTAFPDIRERLIEADFLKYDLAAFPPEKAPESRPNEELSAARGPRFSIIGNFPYNISSQILFRVLAFRDRIPETIGMFQKELADRITAPPGNKTYGILSVLIQSFFETDYLFTVGEQVFSPPPKVKSAVIRLRRNGVTSLGCDETLFFRVVKTAFNQRRKTLRNALKPLPGSHLLQETPSIAPLLELRAERLTIDDFIRITRNLHQYNP